MTTGAESACSFANDDGQMQRIYGSVGTYAVIYAAYLVTCNDGSSTCITATATCDDGNAQNLFATYMAARALPGGGSVADPTQTYTVTNNGTDKNVWAEMCNITLHRQYFAVIYYVIFVVISCEAAAGLACPRAPPIRPPR